MDMRVFAAPIVATDSEPVRGLTFGGRLRGWMTEPLIQCTAFIVVVSFIFILLPGIDVWFTGLFAAPNGGGFPVSRLPAFQFLRDTNRTLTWVVPVALIVVLLVKLARPDRPSLVPPAKTLFILSTLAIGPGLITNVLFKNNWGRPRPNDVDLFGGAEPFVQAWRITKECATNCSFISGEGSSSIWLLSLAVLVPLVARPSVMKWLFAYAALISLNRIAYGGHFLSDVLLAWGFTVLVMLVVYRVTVAQPIAWFENDRMEANLTRAGVWVRRRLGFPTQGFDARPEPIAVTHMPLPPDVPAPSTKRGRAAER